MPTFGYATIGATVTYKIEDRIQGSVFKLLENGLAKSITVYLEVTTDPHHVKCPIYQYSDLSFVGETEERDIPVGADWQTFKFTTYPTLSANVKYILPAWGESTTGNLLMANDTGVTDQGTYQALAYNGFPDPLVPTGTNTRKYSIYCTYEALGGKLWERLKRTFSKHGSLDVTLRTLSLGDRDEESGHRAKSYSDSTIQMLVLMKGARQQLLNVGTYCRLDAVGFTNRPVKVADEIQSGDVYYEVDAVRPYKITPGRTEYYKCDLTELPLHD